MPTLTDYLKRSLTVMVLLGSCAVAPYTLAETPESDPHQAHHAQESMDWPGVYYGFLPCADCKGIKTMLALNKNNTYLLISQYVGKSEREIVEKGRFAPGEKADTLVLTPRNGAEPRHYSVGVDTLVQLDNNGNHIINAVSDRYTLRKNEMAQQAPQSSSHH